MRRAGSRAWCWLFVLLVSACAEPDVAPRAGQKLRSDCVNCHAEDYQRAHGPGRAPEVPDRCAVCHREEGFRPVVREHPWALTGAHEDADCLACHRARPPVFEGLPAACVDCHRDDYARSEFPGHDRFPLSCGDCHGTAGWKPAERPAKVDAGATPPDAPAAEPPTPEPVAAKPAKRRVRPKKPTPPTGPAPMPNPAPAPTEEPSQPPPPAPTPAPPEHPEARFPITRGNHVGIECADCHAGGGQNRQTNTDCVQCHKRTRYDPRHQGVDGYPLGPAQPYFCVHCHTQGTRRPTGQ